MEKIRVTLRGLSREDLNGRSGVCEGHIPSKPGRMSVRLDDGGPLLAVKVENIDITPKPNSLAEQLKTEEGQVVVDVFTQPWFLKAYSKKTPGTILLVAHIDQRGEALVHIKEVEPPSEQLTEPMEWITSVWNGETDAMFALGPTCHLCGGRGGGKERIGFKWNARMIKDVLLCTAAAVCSKQDCVLETGEKYKSTNRACWLIEDSGMKSDADELFAFFVRTMKTTPLQPGQGLFICKFGHADTAGTKYIKVIDLPPASPLAAIQASQDLAMEWVESVWQSQLFVLHNFLGPFTCDICGHIPMEAVLVPKLAMSTERKHHPCVLAVKVTLVCNTNKCLAESTRNEMALDKHCDVKGQRRCSRCGCKHSSSTPLKQCNRCRCVYYCSTVCQREDWKEHKRVCVKTKKSQFAKDVLDLWKRKKENAGTSQCNDRKV